MVDVAISFVAADEPLALQLRDQLQPPLDVFVYSKYQEDLAGRDGIEAFRTVFRDEARLVVILHRAPWGDTPWTRVEKTAIEELCLAEGWEHLMFVRLDRETHVPKWVPKPHLYLDLTTFTLADLAGAVKARIMELGVQIVRPSVAERAAAQARRRAFDLETKAMLERSPVDFTRASSELLQAVRLAGEQVAERTGWRVEFGDGAFGGFVINAQGQTLQIATREIWANTARNAYVELTEYDQHIPVRQPGYSYHMPREGLDSDGTRRVDIRRLPELGWCWELDGQIQGPTATGEAIVHILLDRIERAHRTGNDWR